MRRYSNMLLFLLCSMLIILLEMIRNTLQSNNIFKNFFALLPSWAAIGLLPIIIVLYVIFTHWQKKLESFTTISEEEALSGKNRQIILGYIRDKWITGFFKKELYYDKILLPLGLHKCIGDPSDLVLRNPFEQSEDLPLGTTITQVFDQSGGELLILGEGGAGKTTLLLQLTADLLERAQKNEWDPIPVVFKLSSWAIKQVPLEQWLVEELEAKYHISSQIGQFWVKDHRCLLLLDGLDEVAPGKQPACIEAINNYAWQAQKAMVVCCRIKEYQAQSGRLCLRTAVSIQPLTPQQIDGYLSRLGTHVSGLRYALQQSEVLRTFAMTPLFLKMLIETYHGKSTQEVFLLANIQTARPYQLAHNYVERMLLQRVGTRFHSTPQQTKQWLAWLAHQMVIHNQTEFYLEQLQPDWLSQRQKTLYRRSMIWITVLLYGSAGGLGIGLLYSLVSGPVGVLVGVLVGGLITMLSYGLVGALIGGLIVGVACWLLGGLNGGLIFGLLYGLVRWLSYESYIRPTEKITWSCSWDNAGFGLIGGLTFGLTSGLLSGLIFGLAGGLLGGLIFGLIFGVFVILFTSLSCKSLAEHTSSSPKESFQRSAINGLILGLVYGLFIGLIAGLATWLLARTTVGLIIGPAIGLIVCLIMGLNSGWEFLIQHSILRIFFWRANHTPVPWYYIAFLNDVVDRQILRSVGGGYVFRHNLLQKYLASLETNNILHNADLCDTNLRNADLSGADLSGADLSGTDLSRANLHNADLRGANLHNADLDGADLRGANLHNADLCDTNLRNADLDGADLSDASITEEQLKIAKSLEGATLPDGSTHPQ